MSVTRTLPPELEPLARTEPGDYFHGVEASALCRPNNLLVFVRTRRHVLHDSGFAARPHHRYVLLVNLAASATVSVDGVTYRLHAGEAFLIAPFQLHFYLDVEAAEICWLFFTFEAPERTPFEPFLNNRLSLTEEDRRDALALAELYQRVSLAAAGARETLILRFELFLNRLRQAGLRRLPPALSPNSHYELLDRVNRLLGWHLEERLTIASLAQRLALSESHLRKRFHQLHGMSLGAYLLHYRLNRAVKLLVPSNLPLTQIALECGYDSLAAFSRAFKAKVGRTPSAFRRAGQ